LAQAVASTWRSSSKNVGTLIRTKTDETFPSYHPEHRLMDVDKEGTNVGVSGQTWMEREVPVVASNLNGAAKSANWKWALVSARHFAAELVTTVTLSRR
jgi:hypothetical protein